MTPSILDIADRVGELPAADQRIFERIFVLDAVRGVLKLPLAMVPWAKKQFGSTSKVTSQKVIRITNRITLESSVYNPLRALRPHNFKQKDDAVSKGDEEVDLFSKPLDYTAEDVFGRVKGKYCITGANIAKCEEYHCVVVFNNPDPLDFGCSEVADYIETGWSWAKKAHNFDPLARYCVFLWNCANRAGASIRHGHAQVILGRGSHYARVEHLRAAALEYEEKFGANYFEDLFRAHEALGLAWKSGDVKTMVYLTAIKQNEVMVLSPALTKPFTNAIYGVLESFRDKLNVKSFNVGIVFPALGDSAGWEGFPLVARMVDRGDTGNASSDLSAMEFYAANVVNSDPWQTAEAIK